MTNPTRPQPGQVIDSPWGRAVADTVVRRFTSAGARDADLAGHTAADLLGQIVVLTDTGQVLQYAGPVLGWKPPWSTAWGTLASLVSTVTNMAITGTIVLATGPNYERWPGRWHQAHTQAFVVGTANWGPTTSLNGLGAAVGGNLTQKMGISGTTVTAITARLTVTPTLNIFGEGCGVDGGSVASLGFIADTGPAASPTAVSVDGWDTTDEAGEVVRVPGLVTADVWRDALAAKVGDLVGVTLPA